MSSSEGRGRSNPDGRRDPDLPAARRLELDLVELVRRIERQIAGTKRVALDRLSLDLDLSGGGSSPTLSEQIRNAVAQAAAEPDVLVPGHAYCHRCESSRCEHSRPPRPAAVFAGYGTTGQPEWSDLAQVLLDRKDGRVEELFADPPATLALVELGRELKGRQLHPFGRGAKSSDLLAQLVAGYFGSRRDMLFAVTVQAVESRHRDGRIRLTLNLLGCLPGSPVESDPFAATPGHFFSHALAVARRKLRDLEDAANQTRPSSGALKHIPAILHQIRRAVERNTRLQSRRTLHASERRADLRPTQTALSDAWSAAEASFLADDAHDTVIVLGPKGRVHAFARDGRHVTSFTVEKADVEKRIRRQRWRPARAAEIETLHRALPPRPGATRYEPAR